MGKTLSCSDGQGHAQFNSVTQSFLTLCDPWTAACQASLTIANSWSLLKLMSVELVLPSNHVMLCCSLLLLPSIFPSIRVFSNESDLCIRWPKDWSIGFSISPSNEYSGNQPWILIGRTDAEAVAPILWPPDAKI